MAGLGREREVLLFFSLSGSEYEGVPGVHQVGGQVEREVLTTLI